MRKRTYFALIVIVALTIVSGILAWNWYSKREAEIKAQQLDRGYFVL